MNAQRINQQLRERRIKMDKLKNYRKGRIYKKFNKMRTQSNRVEQQKQQNEQMEDGDKRKIEFYKQTFSNKEDKIKKQRKGRQIQKAQDMQMKRMNEKVDKLKSKKKKFIKKMKQKTHKGQPVMKNYIGYALTKLQEDMAKHKLQSIKQKK